MTDGYFDFSGWAQIDYTCNCIPGTAPVPETSTALLALLGLVATVRSARRCPH